MHRRSPRAFALAVLAMSCAPGNDAVGVTTAEQSSASSSTSTTSTTGTTTSGTSTSSTSGVGDDSTTGTAGMFVPRTDGGPTFRCDVFTQDCPAGEKCAAWSNDGSPGWNSTRCVDVAAAPGQVGDACTVEGPVNSGLDDCDVGMVCWFFDARGAGECVALCRGSPEAPICEDETTHCTGWNLPMCLATCDPLAPDCGAGEGCYPVGAYGFFCDADASGQAGAYGDGCVGPQECDPGLVCIPARVHAACASGSGCCSTFCALADPESDTECAALDPAQTCVPWYEEGFAPPGHENVGVCALAEAGP